MKDEGLSEGIRREARVVGLSGFSTPSLETVERRRLQLWVLTALVLMAVSLAVVALATWPVPDVLPFAISTVLRVAVVLLSAAFCAYAIEKELHLHRLARLLVDERVLSTALTNRLHEVSLLLETGKAINSVLDLKVVLDTILGSAIELLGGTSGSIMLAEEDELVTVCVRGNDHARGSRMRFGEGIAGHVAAMREPLLIDGDADPADFPGLVERAEPIDSAISTPLVSRDEVVGVLNVNTTAGRIFTEYDLRAMSVFAEQAAAAIANAKLYEAERQHVAELIQLDRMQSEFVSLVSHELRTPITSILGAIAVTHRPDAADLHEEMDDIVERQARRLSGMVEDLLTAARLGGDGPTARAEVVDIAELVRTAAFDASLAGTEVAVVAPDTALVLGDAESIRRLLDNLVDNARKYGEPPILVEVASVPGRVVVSVVDAGPGVPEAEWERVFERFQRLETDRSQPGLGLGLPIVRGLARSLGGDVWIEEAPGGGAAFRVRLRPADDGAADHEPADHGTADVGMETG